MVDDFLSFELEFLHNIHKSLIFAKFNSKLLFYILITRQHTRLGLISGINYNSNR